MNKIKTFLFFSIWLMPMQGLWAQENNTKVDESEEQNDNTLAGFFDTKNGEFSDFSTLKLPPLEILFTNAKSNPSIELLAKEERIAKELLKKEKTEFLSHLTGHGSYSYGVMDNYGSNSSVTSPIYYQYMGSKQHYWNIGASVSFSAEDIIDAKRKVKRQQLEVDRAGIEKDIAYEELKQKIVSLYVKINTEIVALKTAADNNASYKGAGLMTEKEFQNGDATIRELAETRRWESDAVTEYQNMQAELMTNILTLEIITHTPIITNVTTDITIDNIDKK